jgi:S1-C subfamily serine protease
MRYRIPAIGLLLIGFLLTRPLTPPQIVANTEDATVVIFSTQTITNTLHIPVYKYKNHKRYKTHKTIPLEITQEVTSMCAGFLVSPDGFVATAAHCINDNNAKVYLRNDNPSDKPRIAKIMVVSKALDVALIKIDVPKNTPYLRIDPNDQPEGTKLYTVGHPLGFFYTATDGICSRYMNISYKKGYLKLLQVSIPIDHGNSGGAIVNDKGEVVGIVSRHYFSVSHLNAAVPGDTLYTLIHNIINVN